MLPQAKAVSEYKHKKALQQEVNVATSLINKQPATKANLHYDSTSYSRIVGE